MPVVDVPTDPGFRSDVAQAPVAPDWSGLVPAAFRQANSVVSLASDRHSLAFPPEPNYSALPDIQGTKYLDNYAPRFAGSNSSGETASIKQQIDQEEADRNLLGSAGGVGVIAQMLAATVDPTMLLPGGMEVKATQEGLTFGRAALRVGLAAGVATTAQEAALQASQETRPLSESVLNVGSATLLTALIGGGAASMLAPAERSAMVKGLSAERAAMDAHASGAPASAAPGVMPEPAGTGMATAAGAAAADTRNLELVPFGLDQIPVVSTGVKKISPMQTLLRSDSLTARRAAADLSETPLLTKENLQGETTTLAGGPALDAEARLLINQARVAVGDELNRQFTSYRFNDQPPVLGARVGSYVQDIMGRADGKMSFADFKAEVTKAGQQGDVHEIPQVQMAAQFIRNKIFDAWGPRAEKAIDGFEQLTSTPGESYMHRVWNKAAIAAKRNQVAELFTDHYAADQAAKAAAKQRLALYSGALQSHETTIAKIEAQLQGRGDALTGLEARADEITRLNKFAYERAQQLRESQYANVGGIREDRPGKGIDKARGGAVFETKIRGRGNDLADRASGTGATISDLERRLLSETDSANAVRGKIEKELAAWEGKSSLEAKGALKAREQYIAEQTAAGKTPGAAGRLSGADSAVDSAMRRILGSDRDLSRPELRSVAEETIDRILSSPDGRLPYDMANSDPRGSGFSAAGDPPRGPLAGREFHIPDAVIRPYLEGDIEHVLHTYLRTMVPDVLMAERFGDTAMTEAFRKINEEFAALSGAAKSEAKSTAIEKQRQNVIGVLSAMRDRIRGTYGISNELPMRNARRVAQAVKNFNVPVSMGMAAISSLPDAAGAVFRHGMMTAFRDAWVPYFKGLLRLSDAYPEAKRQFRAMGIAIESEFAQRQHTLSDTLDSYRPQSRLERALQWTSDKSMVVNLLAPWTDAQKTMASMVAGSEILRAVDAAAAGKATARQLRTLGESNIKPELYERIAKAFKETGEVRDGVHLPNTADWRDLEARRVFEGAVARDANIAVVTPGQEKPLWMSHPVYSIFGQFQSFTAGANERILIANLQRRDAQVMQGVVSSLALGMLSYKLNAITGGQPTSDNPADWFKEAMSRSNLIGWMEWGNALASKATGGSVDVYRMLGAPHPMSRYASRSALDQLLGPTAGKIEDLLKVTSAVGRRDWNASDSHALRRMTFAQNLFYLRPLFDQIEAGANNAFGIQMPASKH